MVTKTPEEMELMSPEDRKAHFAAEEKIVFGHDVEKKKGVPIEKGIGAPGRESRNHFMALRKHEGEDAYREAYEEFFKRNPEGAKRLNLPKPASKAA